MVLEAVKLIFYYCCNTDLGILWNSPPFKIKEKKKKVDIPFKLGNKCLRDTYGQVKRTLVSCVFCPLNEQNTYTAKWDFQAHRSLYLVSGRRNKCRCYYSKNIKTTNSTIKHTNHYEPYQYVRQQEK